MKVAVVHGLNDPITTRRVFKAAIRARVVHIVKDAAALGVTLHMTLDAINDAAAELHDEEPTHGRA